MNNKFDANSIESVDTLDDLPFWSATFGIELLNNILYKKNMNVLDIGCGCGFPALELSERLGNSSKIFGIDLWAEALQRAEKKKNIRGVSNIEFIRADAEDLPFENNSIDLVVSNNGINNVSDINRTFSEIYRVLKSSSQFIFTVNLPETLSLFYEIFYEILEKHGLISEIELVKQHIFEKRKPTDWYEEYLSKNNFKIINKKLLEFQMKYSDGTSFLGHSLIKFFFRPPWESFLKENQIEIIFKEIEEKLNSKVIFNEGISMNVPFVIFDCRK